MVELDIENKEARVIFLRKGKQKIFLNKLQTKLGMGLEDFSKIAGVCVRSMTDWKREKNSMSLFGLEALCKNAKINFPRNIEIRDKFWYIHKGARAGGLATFKKYGRIGNEKYRKEKWFEWWNKIGKFNPNQYFAKKDITIPKESNQLAEMFGIILGDGCITKSQLTVTLNKDDDKNFINYVAKLFEDQFGVKPSLLGHKNANVINIVISRKKLIVFLLEKGLKIGNKVRQQVAVPRWIHLHNSFMKYCIRGLLDTDGCFFIDKHRYKDKIYYNCGINFTNRSLPLLNFFRDNLTKFGYHPTQKTEFSIFLRREDEIIRYFKEIGSSNPKHLNKFRKYLNNKLIGGLR